MIYTDIFLEKGNSHKICEDYIIQGSSPIHHIILSDGCSTSKDTSVGSMILSQLSKQYIKYRKDNLYDLSYEKLGTWVIHNAEMTARQLGLSLSCLTATLTVATVLDNVINIFMYGDGSVILKDNSGKIKSIKVDFTNNAPYYLVYGIDSYRGQLYHEMKNDKIITTIEDVLSSPKISTETQAYDYPTTFSFNKNDFDTILVCSDGISSFVVNENPITKRVDLNEYINSFMLFYTIKGEYLKRSVAGSLKELLKKNVVHYDDLSMGSFLSVKEES